MATPYSQTQQTRSKTYAMGGSALEGIGGLAVVALSILALVGTLPLLMTAIAGIIFGASLLLKGIAVSAQYRSLQGEVGMDSTETAPFAGGLTVESLIGAAAIALGILALVRIDPQTLLAALVTAGGVALLLSAGTVERLNNAQATVMGLDPRVRRVTEGAASGAVAVQMLAGLASLTLGVLALTTMDLPVTADRISTLTMIGMLVLGSSIMLSGGALSTRMASLARSS